MAIQANVCIDGKLTVKECSEASRFLETPLKHTELQVRANACSQHVHYWQIPCPDKDSKRKNPKKLANLHETTATHPERFERVERLEV